MPVVERRRALLIARIGERMQAFAQTDGGPKAELAAKVLIDLLIAAARDIAAFAGVRELSPVRAEHRRLGIAGPQYSRFGLALGPALRAELGLAMSPQMAAAWCDTFWLVVGAIAGEPPREAQHFGSLSASTAPPTDHRFSHDQGTGHSA